MIYEQQVYDSDEPKDVEPEEDVWGTGEDLESPIDYQEITTGDKVESEIEIDEIVERLKRKMLLRRIIREQAPGALPPEEEAMADVEVVSPEVPAEEERASASQQSLRDWLKDTAGNVAGMAIPDGQIPALIASMDDLILSAQSGKMTSREDKVRANIDTE